MWRRKRWRLGDLSGSCGGFHLVHPRARADPRRMNPYSLGGSYRLLLEGISVAHRRRKATLNTTDLIEALEGLRKLDSDYPRAVQGHALHRLLWYLNSGGKRSFQIVSRPDEKERSLPRPDYVCWDMASGSYVTVEVTRIIHHPDMLKVEAHKEHVWKLIAKHVGNSLRGQFALIAPVRLETRGTDLNKVARQITQAIIETSPNMSVGQKMELPLELTLMKLKDEGSMLWPPVTHEDDEESDDPINLMTPAQIVRAIMTPLEEANSKLCAYSQGTRVLLLDSEFWFPAQRPNFRAVQKNERAIPYPSSLSAGVRFFGRDSQMFTNPSY